MKSSRMAVAVAVLFAALTGCGETYIDESSSATTVPDDTTTTVAPVPDDASVSDLVAMLESELSTLSQAVIDDDDLDRRSARIEEIWTVLEPKLDGAAAVNTGEVIDLARSAINSRRPADADKAYRLLLTATDAS